MLRNTAFIGAAVIAALAASAALAAISHNSTRSNISKKPGLAFAAAGVGVSLQTARRTVQSEASTNRKGEAVFRSVPIGDYTIAVTPVETRAGKIDGLEVWGGVVDCTSVGIREGQMTCTVKVTFDGKARKDDLKVALLTVAPGMIGETVAPRGVVDKTSPSTPRN